MGNTLCFESQLLDVACFPCFYPLYIWVPLCMREETTVQIDCRYFSQYSSHENIHTFTQRNVKASVSHAIIGAKAVWHSLCFCSTFLVSVEHSSFHSLPLFLFLSFCTLSCLWHSVTVMLVELVRLMKPCFKPWITTIFPSVEFMLNVFLFFVCSI